jgi:thiamine-monophosphate kinase
MKLSQIGELTLLEQIRKRFEKRSPDIVIGIGDDAALLKPFKKNILVTTDMMVEGVHFNMDFITPYQLGYKLVSVNVSDIYAMGGIPRFLLLGIAMNRNTAKEAFDRFFDGVHEAMKHYGLSLVGGDISSASKGMSLSATLIGYAEKFLKRSGAKKGDSIYVTGNLGDSACGLELLKKVKRPIPLKKNRSTFNVQRLTKKLDLTWNDIEPLLTRHLMPKARDPRRFIRYATSMIDISDGLLIDLSRLCDESKVGARIYTKNIPVSSELKKAASCLGISPIRLALSGGEDYELLFTAPRDKRVKAIYIGDIAESERVIIAPSGKKKTFSAEGYQHFGIQR